MCLQLSGGWLLLCHKYSGPDSLPWLFSFSFFVIEKQEVCLSWQFSSVWSYLLLPLGGSTESTAIALCSKGLGVKWQGSSQWPPTPLASVHSVSPFSLRKNHSEACAFANCFSNGSSFLPNGPLLCIRNEIMFSAPVLFGDKSGIYNSICNHTTFPFIMCGSLWKWMSFSWGRDSDHPLISFLLEGLSPNFGWIQISWDPQHLANQEGS